MLEESEEIISLNHWVLQTVCNQLLTWKEQGFPIMPIAINLSPRQFYSQTLIEQINTVLKATNINPHFLQLEIAEATLMQDLTKAIQIVEQLQELGIGMTVDDFGSDNNFFKILQKFHFQTLKIAPIFIQNLTKSSEQKQMISMMVSIGDCWGKKVVAKGVETQQQSWVLQQLQCYQMQGYLWSMPQSVEAITQYLAMQTAKRQYNNYIQSNLLVNIN